ncbi:MAG: glycosyltransferase [Verrucomicrobiales bacterium]|nr:glycosyltransferase [Verrucomicrobiales bacterium]
MENSVIILLQVVFWSPVVLLGFSYAIYPWLLKTLGQGRPLSGERFVEEEEFPEVAVLMAVYNEEAVLSETLQSIFESDYPKDKIRVLIGSDGSTDRSHEIIQGFQRNHPELDLKIFPGRNGKIRIVNQLAKDAADSFLDRENAAFVLCDANVAWSEKALRNMVRHLKRSDVGMIGSCVRDKQINHTGIGHEEEAYVGRENQTKYFEGVLWGNMMGGFGACYALRAELFAPVPEEYIVDDFYQTMACLKTGSKAIVDLEAEVYESVSVEIEEEFRRKTRIATGNFQNLSHFGNFFLPWNGRLANAFAFWSHKGIRWFGPHLLVLMTISVVILSALNPLYLIPLGGLLTSVLLALLDWGMSLRIAPHVKFFRFIRYFYAMNGAVFLGWVAFQRGVSNSVWEPTKRVERGDVIERVEATAK